MPLTIDLSPADQARLAAAARQKGVAPAELAREIVTEHLPPVPEPSDEPQDPTLALFAQWEKEDAQMTPEEIEGERRLWEQFKQNINAERARAGARIIYP